MRHTFKKTLTVFPIFLALILSMIGVTPAYAAGSIYVIPGGDDNNACLSTVSACATIQGALGKASSGDTLYVATGMYTGTATEVVLIDKSISISGGWSVGFTSQSGQSTIDGQHTRRGIQINSGVIANLDRFLIQNSSTSGDGGGIYNANGGTLTITNSTLVGNSAGQGGGIMNGGTLTITASTLSLNHSTFSGGSIYNDHGALTMTNSTLSSNFAGGDEVGYGGGIYNSGGTLTITNSTLSGNFATGEGNGIFNFGTLNYANTIIASIPNAAKRDCLSIGTIGTNINNLVQDGNCSASLSGAPKLGTLANNNGPTQTLALLPGSIAINAGDDQICAAAPVSNKDQRGVTRPKGTHCDIGSYEAGAPSNPLTLYSLAAQDGTVIEASENSNRGGGSADASKPTFNLGDDAKRRQHLGILSFATGASLPDEAVISSVVLKFKRQAVTGGGNPVANFQGFMLDVKKGSFDADSSLQISDFQALASKSYGPFNTPLVGGWYTINLTAGKDYINKLSSRGGLTQIRLRFKLDDNNDAVANDLSLYSGDAAAAYRPQLVITYSLQ